MSDLILEIGCEEIPHDLLDAGINGLNKLMGERLDAARLSGCSVAAHGTPRRLTVIVRDLPANQPDVEVTAKGPSAKVAIDADGNPTRAGEGFARGQKVSFADLTVVDGYMSYTRLEKGRTTAEVLAELIPTALGDLHWAKAMRWGHGNGPFVRPIKWICAVLDGQTVPFEFVGVQSGNTSRGHRFMAPDAFTVSSADDYLQQLAAAKVVLSVEDRVARISDQVAAEAAKAGGLPELDHDLIRNTALKTEWPVAVLGSFDADYLKLPKEVLLTSMKEHQDDFGVVKNGDLMAHFVAVADNEATDMQVVSKGNERVLRARLEDARFFYNEDQKQSLADLLPRLDSFMFQKQLGSVAEKVARVTALTRTLAANLGANVNHAGRAAELCKADLVCNMVYEFPELQGIMGHAYAIADGEPAAAAQAIEEHYLPRFAGDDLPASPEGTALALADKIDTLAGIFGCGMIPSGSQDPYALRRAGLGVALMLSNAPTQVNLGAVVRQAVDQLADKIERDPAEVATQVHGFLGQRLGYGLAQGGMRADVVKATLAGNFDDAYDARLRAEALDNLARTDGFADLMIGFKRILKIIPNNFAPSSVNTGTLQAGAEADLWQAFIKAQSKMGTENAATERLAAMANMRPQIDAFFDSVMVMDEDATIRQNRLSMLSEIRDTFSAFADFSRVSA
jgi:glycyl-tRNA synthetase beta chain